MTSTDHTPSFGAQVASIKREFLISKLFETRHNFLSTLRHRFRRMDEKIRQTIKQSFEGVTLLVIAHRLETIMDL